MLNGLFKGAKSTACASWPGSGLMPYGWLYPMLFVVVLTVQFIEQPYMEVEK